MVSPTSHKIEGVVIEKKVVTHFIKHWIWYLSKEVIF